MRVLRSPMLSVPTLWTVFVVNFLAVALIWAYVAYTYPKFEAAKFWAASRVAASARRLPRHADRGVPAAAAAASSAATVMIFAACLVAMGIERFYERPISWRRTC